VVNIVMQEYPQAAEIGIATGEPGRGVHGAACVLTHVLFKLISQEEEEHTVHHILLLLLLPEQG
jgi:hypothetical protein